MDAHEHAIFPLQTGVKNQNFQFKLNLNRDVHVFSFHPEIILLGQTWSKKSKLPV